MRYKYTDAPEVHEMTEDQQKLMLDLMDMDGTDVAVVELTYTIDGTVEVKHLAQYRKNPYEIMWVEDVARSEPNFAKALGEVWT